MNKRTRVFIKRQHIASVSSDLLQAFQRECGVVNYAPWVRQLCFERFGVDMEAPDALSLLEQAMVRYYYDSVGEWLQDEMRKRLSEKELIPRRESW